VPLVSSPQAVWGGHQLRLAERQGDVDPILLREFHNHPQPRGEEQPQARRGAGGVVPKSNRLVGDDEELERVREYEQHRARLQQLEEHVADEPVVVDAK
jgi:hypothetical protein